MNCWLRIDECAPGLLYARVVAPDGTVLQPGDWIEHPTSPSQVAEMAWYHDEYGDLPAVDLDWRSIEGATSVWPVRSFELDNAGVTVTGPRGTLHLTVGPADHT